MFESTLKRDDFGKIVDLNFKKYKKLVNTKNISKDVAQKFIENSNSEIEIAKFLFDIDLKIFPKNLDLNNLNIALYEYLNFPIEKWIK